MKRARGHASGHPRMSFCVVNVIVGVVRVCVARARSHGRWGLSAVTAVRVPRPAPSRSASGEVRHRGPPSARCARVDSRHFVSRLFALADSYRTRALRQGSTERYRLTVRSGRRPCDAAGGALLRLLRALRSRFRRALGPRSGRQEPVAFYLLKQSRSRDSSAPAAVRGVAAPASRRAVPCGLRLGYVL
jgi:hypothetical protein